MTNLLLPLRYLKIQTIIFIFLEETEMSTDIQEMLSESEKPFFAVKSVRDEAVFTDRRIVILDRKGFSGKKQRIWTIPYRSILNYSVATMGSLDFDSEIFLTLIGNVKIQLRFLKGRHMNSIVQKAYKIITRYVIG